MVKKYSIVPSNLFEKKYRRKKANRYISCIVLLAILSSMVYTITFRAPVNLVNEKREMSIDSYDINFPDTITFYFNIDYDEKLTYNFNGNMYIDDTSFPLVFSFSEAIFSYTVTYNFSKNIGMGISILVSGTLEKVSHEKTYIKSKENINYAYTLILDTHAFGSYYASDEINESVYKITFGKTLYSDIYRYRGNITCVGDVYIYVDENAVQSTVFGDIEEGMHKITSINHTLPHSSTMTFETDFFFDPEVSEIPDVYGKLIDYRFARLTDADLDPIVYFTNFTLYLDNGYEIELKNTSANVTCIDCQ